MLSPTNDTWSRLKLYLRKQGIDEQSDPIVMHREALEFLAKTCDMLEKENDELKALVRRHVPGG